MNIAVAQSGGPTAAINSSLCGVFDEAEKYNERKKAALKRKECLCLLEQREKNTMMGVVMGIVFF